MSATLCLSSPDKSHDVAVWLLSTNGEEFFELATMMFKVIKTVIEASAFPARSWLCLTYCGLMILLGEGSNSSSNMNMNIRRKAHPLIKSAQFVLSHRAEQFTSIC